MKKNDDILTIATTSSSAGRTRRRFIALCGALPLLRAASASAQGEHKRVIKFIVPFAAGSSTDSVSRIIIPDLSERLNATIIVDNRAGSSGLIGADAVVRSPPNGLTFLVGGASVNVVNPWLFKTLPYDPVRDLVPVARIGIAPMMLLVHPSMPFNDVASLIDYAKKNPSKLAYGTSSSSTMVGMETFKRNAGIDLLSVPYKSSPQAVTDLIANHVQMIFSEFATGMPMVRSGKAKVIAVTMQHRSGLLPDVPTVGDVLKGFDITGWLGLYAPRGTPRDVVAQVSSALEATLSTLAIKERLAILGFDASPLGYEAFNGYFTSELGRWKKLINDAGIQPQ